MTCTRRSPGFRSLAPVALILGLFLVTRTTAGASPRQPAVGGDTPIETFILSEMAGSNIPGLQAAIIKEGQVVWARSFGWSEPNLGVPITNVTLFNLASVSKLITTTSMMQLVDQGLIDLDQPVNDLIPFPVDHPSRPTKITPRMLLTHTGSLKDNWSVMPVSNGDSPYPLALFMEDYFTPAGALYDPALNFFAEQPGTYYAYCNNGFALAGYVVEAVSGQFFDDWSKANTLDAMEMNGSNWRLANLNLADVASPCRWNGSGWTVMPHPGWREYPSTTLRSTALELAQFLIMVEQRGQYRGRTILTQASGQALTTPQIPTITPFQGLGFYVTNLGGREYWGHNGADFGAVTEMGFDKNTGIGVIVLTNGEASFNSIVGALFNHGESLLPAAKLSADVPSISLASGGTQTLTLDGDPARAGWHYRMFGSVSGTVPGMDFGSGTMLPLNFDLYFRLTMKPGLSAFGNFVGQFDGSGNATASLTVPAGLSPTLAGLILEHAYITGPTPGSFVDTSNPTAVELTL